MAIVDFKTAKILRETLGKDFLYKKCEYLYTKDTMELINMWSQFADHYLKNPDSFYPAPSIEEVIETFEELYKIAIYITPRFDGFDKAQIDTYFEIYKIGEPGGNDYSSDAHVGDRYESSCRAIQEVCVLIEKEKNNENN